MFCEIKSLTASSPPNILGLEMASKADSIATFMPLFSPSKLGVGFYSITATVIVYVNISCATV